MPYRRSRGSISLPLVTLAILAGAILLSVLFYTFWQRLNRQVEVILQDQFNQQQLFLARKIADNVESYFDFVENALMGYAGLFQTTPLNDPEMDAALMERFARHQRFGILEIRRYNAAGVGVQVFSISSTPAKPASLTLPPLFLDWAKDPAHRGKLFLSETFVYPAAPWKGDRVMRFLTPLYLPGSPSKLAGVLEFLINPFFICQKATADVQSGRTGYAWIIDQDGVFLAHYEKDFVGKDALNVRIARNPNIIFKGLREIQADILAGKEGVGEYTSGWHRAHLGITPKLVAYTPIRFNKGLITQVTEVQDPAHNLWGVAVVAPAAEVSGSVAKVLHQELFLVGLFFIVVLGASGALIGVAVVFNKSLSRQVELKTEELLESQERLLHSERFAAVGEAAAYVSHEIKNPLMVIGGLANQVARRLLEDPAAQEKLQIIQNEVKRLESFLGDLRDFLRPALPSKQEVDLNQVIQEVGALMGDAIREKGGTLEERLDPDLPAIEADPNQIKQVLVNLVKNAAEATEERGKILVSSWSRDGQVWFAVQDTGKGMSEEVLDKIFHPFFTTKDKGTGLGLAVINKIITDHHGAITVDSTAGQGSTFTVRLPQKGANAA
ncbi:MAG: ATP-binding protein [Syntrophobacterales bacterium]|jgi:signal transduction histidine kinase|nr:ATP-binding protein [Syntrophobacterales bacterium]